LKESIPGVGSFVEMKPLETPLGWASPTDETTSVPIVVEGKQPVNRYY